MSARASVVFISYLDRAAINFSASGDNVVVPAVAGKQIKVYRLKLLCASATALSFKDGVGGTVLEGPMPFSANQGMIEDYTSIDMPPWYTTSPGNALVINSSNAVQIGGALDYSVGT